MTDWDIAVLPEGPDGKVTAKLHADIMGILETRRIRRRRSRR